MTTESDCFPFFSFVVSHLSDLIMPCKVKVKQRVWVVNSWTIWTFEVFLLKAFETHPWMKTNSSIAGWCDNTSVTTALNRSGQSPRLLFEIFWMKSWCQVCCPEFLGTFNNSVTRATEPVYAVSRSLERRKAMIQKENSFSDTIVVRSKTEPVGWSSAEAFFWKEEACFPGRHTR